jgi:hypothetical protein
VQDERASSSRWEDRVKLVEARAVLARAILEGKYDWLVRDWMTPDSSVKVILKDGGLREV